MRASSTVVGPSQAAQDALDPSFGARGKVLTKMATGGSARAVVLQPDGKIVVAGWARRKSTEVVALARYRSNGSLDKGFGEGGRIVATSATGCCGAWGLALQRNGRIVIAGTQAGGNASEMRIQRYRRNGRTDRSFGVNGMVTVSFGQFAAALAVAVQRDGKIIAAGAAAGGFALVRLLADGSLDPSFGGGGKVATVFPPGFADVRDLVAQRDGRIVAVGDVDCGHYCFEFALARYKRNGLLDPTFGSSGTVTTAISGTDVATSAALQRDGKIIVAGSSTAPLGAGDLTLARYTRSGTLDLRFGRGGIVQMQLGPSYADAVAVRRNGQIVAAGGSATDADRSSFLVARFRRNGSLLGASTPDLGPGQNAAHGLAIQRNGKVVAVGAADEYGASGGRFALVRFRR